MKTLEELARECVQGIIDTSYPGKEVFVQNSVKLKILDALKQVRDKSLEEAEKLFDDEADLVLQILSKSTTATEVMVFERERNHWLNLAQAIRTLREKEGK